MTRRLLHTRTKIFFPDPYVVRLEYGDVPRFDAESDYRKVIHNAYRLIGGTWGYSNLEYEMTQIKSEAPVVSGIFNGVNITSLDNSWEHLPRCYFCFKDELDALQFRLSISTRAIQVRIWPERWFTIHEVVETDEQ